METTEHIVESYVRHVKEWFTNCNIKAKGGKEIDIIAVSKKGKKYHIECSVTHKRNFALKTKPSKSDFTVEKKKTKSVKRWRHRNSVDFFIQEKFKDKRIIKRLLDFGFKKNYKKIIVVWQVASEDVHQYAKERNVIIWELKDKIKELMKKIGETYYSDDILRTLQLVGKVNEESLKDFITFLGTSDKVTARKMRKPSKNFFSVVHRYCL